MDLAGVILGSLAVLAVLLLMLTRTLVIVNQASTAIVERLGRFQFQETRRIIGRPSCLAEIRRCPNADP